MNYKNTFVKTTNISVSNYHAFSESVDHIVL